MGWPGLRPPEKQKQLVGGLKLGTLTLIFLIITMIMIFTSLPWPYRLLYSCTRQKGRKDSDGRVQDVRLRISEFYRKRQTKYKDK